MSYGDTSTVTFTGNNAKYEGGAIFAFDCNIMFYGHSTVTFRRNRAGSEGGAIALRAGGINDMSFGENSTVLFTENSAWRGGAVSAIIYARFLQTKSSPKITFHGHSNVTFSNNRAKREGGAISYYLWPNYIVVTSLLFTDHATVMFSNNSVTNEGSGGALAIGTVMPIGLSLIVSFTGLSKVIFSNNTAQLGGTCILSRGPS